jgi:quercetin dioxygenase-like cupin family protein
MQFEQFRSAADSPAIHIPAIGLELKVRTPMTVSDGGMTMIETINAPGFGPPIHRHRETEIFRVETGRYLFEVDGERFIAEAGDVVTVPGGAAHGFVNITDAPASQSILILPGLDATAFFTELAHTMRDGVIDPKLLRAFGLLWAVEFLGPPLKAPLTEAMVAPLKAAA